MNQHNSSEKLTKTVSFNGYEFDVESDKWDLNKNYRVVLDFIYKFDKNIQNDIRETLVYFAEQKSGGHTANVTYILNKYHVDTGETTFNERGLLSWKSMLGSKGEPTLGNLRVFLKQLYSLGYKALDEVCYELLTNWRLSGVKKGIPVLSLCPEDGPFSDMEFEAILYKLDCFYAEEKISLEQYITAKLFAATGRRTVQISGLKSIDFRLDKEILEQPTYILNIPRAKQHGCKFRELFTDCALTDELGRLLKKHIKNVETKVIEIIGRELSEKERKLLPFYPDYKEINIISKMTEDDSIKVLSIDFLHQKNKKTKECLVNAINTLNIVSERTTEKLKVNPYRFRYTLGTRAARENAGILTIAALLDHSDTQNAAVYVQNHPDHAAQISAIMNGPLLKYTCAFRGKIIKENEHELHGSMRIRTNDNKGEIGSCGTNVFCRDYAPIACYLCPKFMPWEDAPHEIVLKYLLSERERIREDTNDLAIASINDRAIIAVTQVINQCFEIKSKKKGALENV